MESERFSVRFAQTQEEKNAVYAMRYENMLVDFRADAAPENGLDITPCDAYAKLVICIDNETKKIVGSYRLVSTDELPAGERFTCEEEFDIDELKASGERIVELSRAVVKREYRSSVVLMLILRFIVRYVRERQYRFVIGDASFCGTDKNAYLCELSYIAAQYAIDERYKIRAREETQIPLLPLETLDVQEIKRNLPPLIRAYLSFGAKMSKDSFTDYEFGSVDVFVLLDLHNYNAAYVERLLRL